MKQKAMKDMNFKGRDIDNILDILWNIKGDKFYFKEYGKAFIESLVKENDSLHGVSVSDSEINKEAEKLANTSGLLTYTDNEIRLGKVAFINGAKFVRDKLTKHSR